MKKKKIDEILIKDFIKKDPKELYKAMENSYNSSDEKIRLNFKDAPLAPTIFFSDSLGKLVENYKDKKLSGVISVKNIDSDNLRIIRNIMTNAMKEKKK